MRNSRIKLVKQYIRTNQSVKTTGDWGVVTWS
jgi:hypothetical protein